jgi:hypothetical protein
LSVKLLILTLNVTGFSAMFNWYLAPISNKVYTSQIPSFI